MSDARWEHFGHEADVGVRGIGPTPASAFEQAAVALTAASVAPDRVRPERCVEVTCSAPSLELLLVDWLNAVVFEMATRGMLFGRYEVRIAENEAGGNELTGRAFGEAVDRERHEPAVEPKGATYTELRVEREPGGGWRAQCVVDV